MDNKNSNGKSRFGLTNFLVILAIFLTWCFSFGSFQIAGQLHENHKIKKQTEKQERQAEQASKKAEKEYEDAVKAAEKESKKAEEEAKKEYEEASKEQAAIEAAHDPEKVVLSYVTKSNSLSPIGDGVYEAEIHFTIRITNNTDTAIDNIAANATIYDASKNAISTMKVGCGRDVSGEILSVGPGESKDFDVVVNQRIYDSNDYSGDAFVILYDTDASNVFMGFQLTYVSFSDGYVLS